MLVGESAAVNDCSEEFKFWQMFPFIIGNIKKKHINFKTLNPDTKNNKVLLFSICWTSTRKKLTRIFKIFGQKVCCLVDGNLTLTKTDQA